VKCYHTIQVSGKLELPDSKEFHQG